MIPTRKTKIFFQNLLPIQIKVVSLHPLMEVKPLDLSSPDGGIGRRAGLKHQWSNPSRFDPGSGYQERNSKSPKVLNIFRCLALFLCFFAKKAQIIWKYEEKLRYLRCVKHEA